MDTTIDKLLGGRIEVEQPAKGYRIAIDTLLLAAAVPARAGQTVLELGCGVGGAMLALAARVGGLSITGIEVESAIAALCRDNVKRNNLNSDINVLCEDIKVIYKEMAFICTCDHVMVNPPYHDGRTHSVSPLAAKRRACAEGEGDALDLWLRLAAQALRDGGTLTLIHRADRRGEIESICAPLFGSLAVKPLVSKEGGACKRVVFRAVKGAGYGGDAKAVASLVLHGPDGRFTPAVEDILRNAVPMVFDP